MLLNTLLSYLGTNLADIRETKLSQRDFWQYLIYIVLIPMSCFALFYGVNLAWRTCQLFDEKDEVKKPLVIGPANDNLDIESRKQKKRAYKRRWFSVFDH